MIKDTLTIFSKHVKDLFDTGTAYSFIVVTIIQKLGVTPLKLDITLSVVSPLEAAI